MKTTWLGSLLALSLLGGAWLGRTPSQASASAPGGARPGARLEELAWLAGRWSGTMSGQHAEEIWSEPAAGGMMGMFRLLSKEQASVYEFLLLEEDKQGVHLRFVHAGPGYKIWEKSGPLVFDLVASEHGRFRFESPVAAQTPTRIVYSRPDEENVIVTVETVREGAVSESFDVLLSRAE